MFSISISQQNGKCINIKQITFCVLHLMFSSPFRSFLVFLCNPFGTVPLHRIVGVDQGKKNIKKYANCCLIDRREPPVSWCEHLTASTHITYVRKYTRIDVLCYMLVQPPLITPNGHHRPNAAECANCASARGPSFAKLWCSLRARLVTFTIRIYTMLSICTFRFAPLRATHLYFFPRLTV